MTPNRLAAARPLRAACALLVGCALLTVSPSARAEDPSAEAAPTFADIKAMLADKNVQYKLDKVVAAVQSSSHEWSAKDVYELVDLGAPPAAAKIAAGKAQMFWDGSAKPLQEVKDQARGKAGAETVQVRGNDELVIVFEQFNDLKYGMEGAKSGVGPLKPKESWEDDTKYQMRKRAWDVQLAEAVGPWEGKIASTTFDIHLTGSFTPHDGSCTRAQVVVDLSQVSFDLFRYTMGGLRVEVPIQVDADSNVESAKWAATGQYRFEATSKPICVSAAQATTLAGQGARLEMKIGRAFDSDTWTGTASFVNAKTGAKL